MADRSSRPETRNPLLLLPAAQRFAELAPEARAAVRALLADLSADASRKAAAAWAARKGPMAAYWRAVAVYARHARLLLRDQAPGAGAVVTCAADPRMCAADHKPAASAPELSGNFRSTPEAEASPYMEVTTVHGDRFVVARKDFQGPRQLLRIFVAPGISLWDHIERTTGQAPDCATTVHRGNIARANSLPAGWEASVSVRAFGRK